MPTESLSGEARLPDRLPPNSPEAERGVLGCILLDWNTATPICVEYLRGGGQEFYDLRHQTIYRTMLELWEDNVPIDQITLRERLDAYKNLEQVGGDAYIASLYDATPSAANVPNYLDILVEKFLARRTIAVCAEVMSRVWSNEYPPGGIREVIDEVEQKILSIRPDSEKRGQYVNVPEKISELQQEYELASISGSPAGIMTQIPDLDRISGGMQPGEMIVLGGLRSSGKTSLGLNVCWNVAKQGIKVGILSMETMGRSLVHRIMASIGEYDAFSLLQGKAETATWERSAEAARLLNRAKDNILIHDDGALTGPQMFATARRMVRDGCKLLMVDYLQLLEMPGKTEYEKVTAASKAVKKMVMQLAVPTIVVCALNREGDKADEVPQMKHLRATGQIEYDASKAWLLSTAADGNPRPVILNVAKGKDSATGYIQLQFFAPQFRFGSAWNGPEPGDVPRRSQQVELPNT